MGMMRRLQMNKDEVVQMISDKEQELRNCQAEQSIVEESDIKLSRELIVIDSEKSKIDSQLRELKDKSDNIKLKRNDLKLSLSKVGHSIKRIQSELRELKNEYWKPQA